MRFPEHIEGARGVYERWDVRRHTAALVAMGRDEEVMRFLGGRQSQSASAEVSRRIADYWATFGFGLWACVDPADGDCLGFTGACRPGPQWDPPFGGEVEVGWRLRRETWGRGLATEGARLAMALVAEAGRRRVIAFVDPANLRSHAVAARLGMRRCAGALDSHLGRRIDVLERPFNDDEPPQGLEVHMK